MPATQADKSGYPLLIAIVCMVWIPKHLAGPDGNPCVRGSPLLCGLRTAASGAPQGPQAPQVPSFDPVIRLLGTGLPSFRSLNSSRA